MDITSIINSKIDLAEFVQEYAHVDLTYNNGTWRGRCPIHDGENPESFTIFPDNRYYCFACDSSGTVINFLSDYEHISYSAAIEKLADILNINLMSDEEYKTAKETERRFVSIKDSAKRNIDKMYQYLTEKRKLTKDTIDKFELGSQDRCLIIPLIDANGRCVGMAKRQFDTTPKYMNSKNNCLFDKSEYLFGLDKARRSIHGSIYVVEGYMDAMSGYQMGLPTVAYCSNELHRGQIKALSQFIRKDTTVILCPDNDREGTKRLPRVRKNFSLISPNIQVRVLEMPDGCKDMNDLLVNGIAPSQLPTTHIDKFVLKLLLGNCHTAEEEYNSAEDFLHSVHSPLIRLDIVKYLSERWDKDYEDLKKYFEAAGEDTIR